MLERYMKGDLGEVSPDLNYTIKKLISGITEQIESFVKGYFLALTLIVQRFKDKIDFSKLINYAVDKTSLSKAKTKSQRKELAFGRLLIFSALSQASVFETSHSLDQSQLEELVNSFFFEVSRIFNQQHQFRESALKTIEKTFDHLSETNPKALGKATSTVLKYTLLKPTEELKDPNDVLKYKISTDADYLSLFFIIKNKQSSIPKTFRQLDEIQVLLNWSFEEDSKYIFKQLRKMFIQETVVFAFPRPHSVVRYLVGYLTSLNSTKIVKSLWKIVFEQYCFNETQLYTDDINKRAKMCLNNLGFYTFQHLLDSPISKDIILSLLTPNFVRVWVNRTNKRRRNRIESVEQLDHKFKQWITENAQDIDSQIKLELIKKLFGPNAQLRFTFKSNFNLYMLIAEDLPEESIQEYISYGETLFKTPDLNEFYPENKAEESSSDNDEEGKQQLNSNKEDNIRIFVLNLIVNTVTIFKNHSETTLKEIINFVVYQAFFQESLSDKMKEFAKDKLFGLVDGLHKRKSNVQFKDDVTSQSLGLTFTNTFLESKSLWINEINKTIGRYALEGNEFNSLDQIDTEEESKATKNPAPKENTHELKLEVHKAFMEFGSTIKKSRKKIYKKLGKLSKDDKQTKDRCKHVFKKVVGLEILVYALALFSPVTPEETKEDLTEIQLSYEKINLEHEIGEAFTGKRTKMTEQQEEEKDQAYQILFDFLISLLTRQNSTLREITNFTFKAFCSELNEGSLANILSILNTPNQEANKILITEEEHPLVEVDEEVEAEDASAEDSEVSDISVEAEDDEDDEE
uniref:Uncharacterized protein n=1 Tax=Euplotes crassus TaxID=5936 RepID=A0A7S3KP36_EUPCR